MEKSKLYKFAKTISGHFSNKVQAESKPNKFSHINIYFKPIYLTIFNTPTFYSEQSYNHAPWLPYRQSMHKIFLDDKKFIIQNYEIENKERIAGAGFNNSLINEIEKLKVFKRNGCEMHFFEKEPGNYIGEIEPGQKCLITKENRLTYVKSKVILTSESWTAEDSGYDIVTDKKVWGSSHGAYEFVKVNSFEKEIKEEWFKKDFETQN